MGNVGSMACTMRRICGASDSGGSDGPDDDVHVAARRLQRGWALFAEEVQLRAGLGIDTPLLHIADNTHDREPRPLRSARAHAFTNRALILVEHLRQRLVHQQHRSPGHISRGKVATLQNGNPHRLQVVDRYRLVIIDVLERPLRRRGVAFEVGIVRIDQPDRREPRHRRDTLNAALRRQLAREPSEKIHAALRCPVTGARQNDSERHQLIAVEPGLELPSDSRNS